MELILKEDVQNLGFKDDIVSVKNGYGRNFLIPTKKAVLATPSARKVLIENLKQRAYKEKKIIDEAKTIAKKLQSLEVKIASKVGSGDKLFGSITSADLADAVASLGQKIDKKFIAIPGKVIKRTGEYEAIIRLHREISTKLPFEIVPE